MKLEKMMVDIVDNWDNSIFFYGGDTSLVGYTEKEYRLLGYIDKKDFQTDNFFDEFNFSNRIKGDNIGQILNDDDKEVLVEHADALFCNVPEEDKIYRYMLKLALHVNRYRYLKTRNKSINNLKTIIRPKLKKHYSKKEKETRLKKLAEEMIILMGGHHVIHEGITNELKKVMGTSKNTPKK